MLRLLDELKKNGVCVSNYVHSVLVYIPSPHPVWEGTEQNKRWGAWFILFYFVYPWFKAKGGLDAPKNTGLNFCRIFSDSPRRKIVTSFSSRCRRRGCRRTVSSDAPWRLYSGGPRVGALGVQLLHLDTGD